MDEFTKIISTEFASEAEDYLDKLLQGFVMEKALRARMGSDPPTVMEVSKRILAQLEPRNFTNVSVALATAMFRLTEDED